MRYALVLILTLWSSLSFAESIGEVLQHSQQARLGELVAAPADTERAQRIRATFDTLTDTLGIDSRARLRIVSGSASIAETFLGHVVVANESLGDLPVAQLRFVLAHELGHVVNDHWSQMGSLYQSFVPGSVNRAQTDAVAAELGESASRLAHEQEFEADAFALRTLHALGNTCDEVLPIFTRFGLYAGTATHPGTRSRVRALRMLERSAGLDLHVGSPPSE